MAFPSAFTFALVVFVNVHKVVLARESTRFQNIRGSVGANTSVPDVEKSLEDLLEAIKTGNTAIMRRFTKIEESIARTYQAMPKNAAGRVNPRSVRYMVHNYFAKEHGWQIKGLAPEAMQTDVSHVHDVTILQDNAPAVVEALLESHRSNTGLTLEDVAAMVAMLEGLILDQSMTLLQAAFHLNDLSLDSRIDTGAAHEVLRSYLLLFQLGLRGNLTDAERHQTIKARMAARAKSWTTLVEFETDALLNHEYQIRDSTNPFQNQLIGFDEIAQVMSTLAAGYGKWQNAECSRMKEELMERDTDGSGRIPLSRFYATSSTREYQFTEKVDYLRQIGALEEIGLGEPRVRVANYITGPSNCIASSVYYSVCCLNECDSLLNELEGVVKAPSATPEQILRVVRNLTSSSMWTAREINPEMVSKLYEVAARSDGTVPLHGRLFAQWLHFVFPHECPFPHVAQEIVTLTAHHWLGGKAVTSQEDREKYIETVQAGGEDEEPLEFQTTGLQWSDEEVLPLLERPRSRTPFGNAARTVVQVAMFFVVARIAFSGCSVVRNTVSGAARGDKMKCELPI